MGNHMSVKDVGPVVAAQGIGRRTRKSVMPADYLLSLTVSIPGTNESAQTDGLAIVYNLATGDVTAKTPEQWIYEEDVEVIKELEEEPAREIPQNDPNDLGEKHDMPDDDGRKPRTPPQGWNRRS
ncbi:uncharacterized protein DNG_02233 [Cephalotrichum gorgonifer]|uniref:Uncharacterized protein n=1 Tax=Cephalotrichum gorgonifer TaxID=2041049 RepID=A0AAE8SSF1_9PEZI|nr:uncharacterized protein DNG_02233 [Cephalotrichum gorgonifer]